MSESREHSRPGEPRQLSGLPAPEELAAVHRSLVALDPAAAPEARALCGANPNEARRLVALPGSFNPPHVAHLALLAAAREEHRADAAAYVLSVRTVDKEQPTGMLPEDRLWLLCCLADVGRGEGVVATNRGLYVEQAEALHRLYPRLEELAFVTGYDKIVQIFDPRYYDDRKAALERLFGEASFLVAPRDHATAADLAALLARPENGRYAARVRPLALPPRLADVSSSRVRRSATRGPATRGPTRRSAPTAAPGATGTRGPGDGTAARPDDDVPALVAWFITESGCYREPAPESYRRRAEAIAAAARVRR